jgi:putative ABC transport system permease protein
MTEHTTRAARSRLRLLDRFRTGLGGLGSRPGRTLLTALGIALGIASMVTVVGISSSSKADLLAELDALGTNLLQVRPGQSLFGDEAKLPTDAEAMLDAVLTVTDAVGVTAISGDVSRNEWDDDPYGLSVLATNGRLTDILQLELETGRAIDDQTQQLPVAVLGAVAAKRLAISSTEGGPTVSIDGVAFQVIGILRPHPLHPDLDRAVMIGETHARDDLGIDPNHSAVYVRVEPTLLDATRSLLARTANPAAPNEVEVSRPSDALEAQTKVDQNLQNLLLALGGVALLVGGVGIANIMVISVIERRSEIGLRRALGATRGHISSQFVIEAAALSTLGGALGLGIGVVATWAYADSQGWTLAIPLQALLGGIAASLAIGAFAGLYPAAKAARLDPAEAVRPHG